MAKFPPHNQRRLNAKIKEIYAGRYQDWYELAIELRTGGATLGQVCETFKAIGIDIGIPTLYKWIRKRENGNSQMAAA